MTDDITTALETVRDALRETLQMRAQLKQDALAALSTIEAGLTDLRMVKAAHDANVKMHGQVQGYYARMREAEAERDDWRERHSNMVRYATEERLRADEAIAALREEAKWCDLNPEWYARAVAENLRERLARLTGDGQGA